MQPLTTKHKKHEANFGLVFRRKFKSFKHLLPSNCQLELKDTRGKDVFYLSEIKDIQRQTNKGLIRLSVATTGSADYMYITTIPLYIVIKFKKNAYIIPIENIDFNKKSVTEKDCANMAYLMI